MKRDDVSSLESKLEQKVGPPSADSSVVLLCSLSEVSTPSAHLAGRHTPQRKRLQKHELGVKLSLVNPEPREKLAVTVA